LVLPKPPSAEAGFPISREAFVRLRDVVYREIGVSFAAGNRSFVGKRIAARARANGSRTFHAYFIHLQCERTDTELQSLINVLTVNETDFFREMSRSLRSCASCRSSFSR